MGLASVEARLVKCKTCKMANKSVMFSLKKSILSNMIRVSQEIYHIHPSHTDKLKDLLIGNYFKELEDD